MATCRGMGGRRLYLATILAAILVVAAAFAVAAAEKIVTSGTVEEGQGLVPVQGHGEAAGAKAQKFVPGELLVKFRAGVSESRKESLHRGHGAKKIRDFKPLRVQRLKLKEGVSVEESVARYQADADVEYAEPNFLVSIDRTPNDPKFYLQSSSLGRIAAAAAWDLTTGSREIAVAVIDTGIGYTHQDLAANMWSNPGEIPGNGLDDDGNGYVDDVHGINAITGSGNPLDDHNHGTHVAGIIGAVGDNGIGIAGVNWAVTLIACKFLDKTGTGNTADAIECLLYLKGLKERTANPVKIFATNNSWGSEEHSQALKDAIAAQEEILFVAAAGNNASSNDSSPVYPANYPLPNLIAVAATDFYDKSLASFSNFGKRSVDVGAPGVQVWSAALFNNDFGTATGTSVAAPHVTGLAALIAASGKDWKQARNLILTGGDALATLSDRIMTGRRINAYGSLTCANRPLLTALDLPSSTTPGVPVTLSVLSIDCAVPLGPVSASVPGGTAQLRDDGVAPDVFANDGIFTGTWIPIASSAQVLTIASPAGIVSVAAPPLILSDTVTVDPSAAVVGVRTVATVVGSVVRQSFSAGGGLAPYTWSIVSGRLPPGLSLSAASGEITGVPTTSGKYFFTINVTDALGTSDVKDWLLIVNEGLRPGWPKVLAKRTGTGMLPRSSSPVFADLEGDGKDELVVADVNTLYLFDAQGLVAKTVLPGMVTVPAIADLDGDGEKEIIVNTSYPSALSPSIYAFHRNLTPVTGFPAGKIVTTNGGCGVAGTPVVADFDNDGNPSILTVCIPNHPNDPNLKKNVLIMVDSRGVMINGWPKIVGTSENGDDRMPAVADLEGDGRREIVLSSRDGTIHVLRKDGSEIAQWSAVQSNYYTFNPVLADLNRDGFHEVAVRIGGMVSVFDKTGSPLPGWPQTFNGHGDLVPADIAGDGWPALLFPTGSFWEVWQALRGDGSSPSGWPVTAPVGAALQSSPVVGDTDGDGRQEVFLSLSRVPDVMLSAYSASGQMQPGYPKYIYPGAEIRTSPALGDLDGNGRVDVAVKAEDGLLYVFEAKEVSSSPRHEWPMLGHDPQHSNAGRIYGPDDFGDLSIVAVSGAISAGELTYAITVKNGGRLAAAASTTGLYLSSSSDFQVASLNTAAIPAGTELVLSGTIPVSSNIVGGTYSVAAVTDIGNVVPESNEANNRTIGNQLTVGNDLAVTGLTGTLGNGVLSYSVTMRNGGNMPAPASTAGIYLSSSTADEFLVPVSIAALPAGSEAVYTGTIAVPLTVFPGTYSVAAVADIGNVVPESNETNNRTIGNQLTVGSDLAVSGLTGTLKKGILTYSMTVKNDGNVPAPASTVGLYFSSSTDYPLTAIGIAAIPAGADIVLTGSVAVPSTIPAGGYALAALADPVDAVKELVETNNRIDAGQFTLGKRATGKPSR